MKSLKKVAKFSRSWITLNKPVTGMSKFSTESFFPFNKLKSINEITFSRSLNIFDKSVSESSVKFVFYSVK